MTPAAPTVSVIIPTYNRARVLVRSVQSVLDQTFADLELLVVDDASTDDTADVIGQITDARIRYVRLPENRGANAARNLGIRQAQGEWIAFQDSDDEWLPRKLEAQLNALQRSSAASGAVYCKIQRFEAGQAGRVFGEPFNRRRLLHHNYVGTPALAVRRSYLHLEPFDEQLPRRQDWELCLRLSQRCDFAFVDAVLVSAYFSPEGVTHSDTKLLQAYRYILAKHGDLIRQSPRALAQFHYVIGVLLAREGQRRMSRSHFLQAVRYWPFALRYWARALASVGGKAMYGRLFPV